MSGEAIKANDALASIDEAVAREKRVNEAERRLVRMKEKLDICFKLFMQQPTLSTQIHTEDAMREYRDAMIEMHCA